MLSKNQTQAEEKAHAKRRPKQSPPQRTEALVQPEHPAAVIQRASLHPHALAPRDVLQLQRTIGNRAVGRLLSANVGQRRSESATVALERDKMHQEAEWQKEDATPVRRKANNTGLPDRLKTGIENLSGVSLHDVQVHYNSSRPARVGASAYTRGTEIYVAPGQEKHLAHEAWHVVQQKQGRVQPTTNVDGSPVNDDAQLEREADAFGTRATHIQVAPVSAEQASTVAPFPVHQQPIQRAPLTGLAGAYDKTTAVANLTAFADRIRDYNIEVAQVVTSHTNDMAALGYPPQPTVRDLAASTKATELLVKVNTAVAAGAKFGSWKTLLATDMTVFPDPSVVEQQAFITARIKKNSKLVDSIDRAFHPVLKFKIDTMSDVEPPDTLSQRAWYENLEIYKNSAFENQINLLKAANVEDILKWEKGANYYIKVGEEIIYEHFADALDTQGFSPAVGVKKTTPPKYRRTVHEWLVLWGFRVGGSTYMLPTATTATLGGGDKGLHVTINMTDIDPEETLSSRNQALPAIFAKYHITIERYGGSTYHPDNPHFDFNQAGAPQGIRWGGMVAASAPDQLTAQTAVTNCNTAFQLSKTTWLADADD